MDVRTPDHNVTPYIMAHIQVDISEIHISQAMYSMCRSLQS